MKALSLMQWVESCGHILILHTSLCRTFVEGPGVGQKKKALECCLINKYKKKSPATFTSSGRDFHNAPRVIAPLT